MGGRKWLVLVVLIAAGPAWGQSEEEVTAAVGKERDAYTQCLKKHVYEIAKSSDSKETIISRAIKSCDKERDALLNSLQRPPLSVSSSDAAEAVDQATQDLRPRMLQTIKEAREQ